MQEPTPEVVISVLGACLYIVTLFAIARWLRGRIMADAEENGPRLVTVLQASVALVGAVIGLLITIGGPLLAFRDETKAVLIKVNAHDKALEADSIKIDKLAEAAQAAFANQAEFRSATRESLGRIEGRLGLK